MTSRILPLAALALFMAGCGPHSGSTDDPSNASPGFIGSWRQFLELDTPSVAGTPVMPRSTPGSTRATGNGQAAEIDQVTDQIRSVYTDASSYITGFPSAEDAYRTLPAKFTAQAEKLRAN